MANDKVDTTQQLRWLVYLLLIVLSTGSIVGRIMQVSSGSRNEPTPFLSANDRSRWCTVRALVDEGTFAIDSIIFQENGERNRAWHTIDLVRHRGTDGKDHYYSSKPTLFSTILAGKYWVLQKLTGAKIATKPFFVGQILLIVTNVLPLVLAWFCLAQLIERYAKRDFTRLFAMAVVTTGTFLSTFAITLNNHLPAALGVVFTLYFAEPLWQRRSQATWRYAIAGLMAAFTATSELPALAFLVFVAAGLAWVCWRQVLLAFVPAALVVAAAAIGTNYWAHGTWSTPYAHRHDGAAITRIPLSDHAAQLNAGVISDELKKLLPDASKVETRLENLRWAISDTSGGTRWALVAVPKAGTIPYAAIDYADGSREAPTEPLLELEIRQWNYWYDYPGTYWTPNVERTSVDFGEPSRAVYTLNVLFGHHGIYSLSPVWLLSVAGMAISLTTLRGTSRGPHAAAMLLLLVVLAFYLSRSQIDRNYGGFCCGLRWMFWFIPIWLLQMLPAVDRLAKSRWGIACCVACLAVSVFSAFYANMSPWQHPWLFDYWSHLGWIDYP